MITSQELFLLLVIIKYEIRMSEIIKFDISSLEDDYQTPENKIITRNLNSPKLDVHNWMLDIQTLNMPSGLVEVQFKNTRKGYYQNSNEFILKQGDIVAVESTPGHDIGRVTLTGQLVNAQIKKNNIDTGRYEFRRVYRIAKPADLEKWEKARNKEHDTMLRARKIAEDLQLHMKIGDVEYQGDGNKAIFYYIADERVDFRELIRALASEFRVRIEMKQIGARQEAGRIGGIGACGRELCCSKWMSKFVSVNTTSARYQELSLNPQKLAGQCSKLKCCLNFELDAYVEAQNAFPRKDVPLETQEGTYYLLKVDVFRQEMIYSSDPNFAANVVTISAKRAQDIMRINKTGKKPSKLLIESNVVVAKELDFENVVGQDDLTRFDKKSRGRNNKRRKGGSHANQKHRKPVQVKTKKSRGNSETK